MGNGNSNTAVRNNHANVIKPILKRPPVYPNAYPGTYAPAPIYYPGYTNSYPIGYNQNYFQAEYYSQAPASNVVSEKSLQHHHRHHTKDVDHHSPHRHHHGHHHHRCHYHRRHSEHACQTSPSLLRGIHDLSEGLCSTSDVLRESSSSISLSDHLTSPRENPSSAVSPKQPVSSATVKQLSSAVVVKQSLSSAAIKQPSSSIVIKKILYPTVDKQHSSPSPFTPRSPASPPTNTSKTVSSPGSSTNMNRKKSPLVETKSYYKNS